MLIDSNIIIYAAKPEHPDLRRLIAEQAPAVSAVSVVEVLGYHRLTEAERQQRFCPCPAWLWRKPSSCARPGK
jgi:hypothetical protein